MSYIFNKYVQLFFIFLSIGLLILYLFKDKYYMIDLENVYDHFYDDKKLDSRMLFNISIDGCNIRGVYEGDSFREVSSTGSNTLEKCKLYNYKMGNDPNEFVRSLLGTNFDYEKKI